MSKTKKNKNSLESTYSSNNRADFSMFLTVFYYCLLIIILPVFSFFLSKHFLSSFDLSSISQNIYSAVIAVVILHVALGFYLMKAYSSDDKPRQTVKQD